jgi:tape measure domain-containing protein
MARQNSQLLIGAKDETKPAFDSVTASALNMHRSITELQTVMRSFLGAEVVQQAYAFTRSIYEARIEADRLRASFSQAVGASGAAAELAFVRREAERLGVPLQESAEAYGKLAAAARGTNMEGAATREVFKAITEAATVFHLSAVETEAALRSVQQMMSKGKVQAEELRGQLGDRLPGAFQTAARAMGVTTAELDKMLENGELLADQFLPRFAEQLRRELAGSVESASQSASADLNRLENAWKQLKQTTSQGLIGDAAQWGIRQAADDLSRLNDEMERSRKLNKSLFDDLLAWASKPFPILAPLRGMQLQQDAEQLRELQGANRLTAEGAEVLRRQHAFPGRDTGVQNTAEAARQWADLVKKYRTADQKAADLNSEIRDRGAAAGRPDTEIERLIAAATQKKTGGGKSDEQKAFDSFLSRVKSEAEAAARAVMDLQAEVDAFGLGDVGKQMVVLERLRDQQAGLQLVAGRDTDAQRGASLLNERIAAEERRLELMQRQAEQQRELAEFQERASARQKIVDDAQESANRVREQLDALRAENETRGMLKSAVEDLTIARMQERLEMIRSGGGSREYADKLAQEIDLRKELKEQLRIRELADESDTLNRSLRETKSVAEQVGLTFTSAAEDAIVHWKGFGNLIQSINDDIVRMLVRRNLTEPLMESIGGGGGAGWLATLGSFFVGGAGVMTGGVGNLASPYAEGGRPTPGELALIGERGPELWVAARSGTVVTNHRVRAYPGARGA